MPPSRLVAIVDDDAEVRGSIESLMRSAGFEVRSFESAATFLDAVADLQPLCLITDLHMPGMDGMALVRMLRRRGLAIPVVAITGYPSHAERAAVAAAGVLTLLDKPFDPDTLVRVVEAATGEA